MSKLAAAVALAAMATMIVASEAARIPAEAAAASEDHALRYPGRPGSTRPPRNAIFPGYPGSRPPSPGAPSTRSPPPPAPTTPGEQPCPAAGPGATLPVPGFPGLQPGVPASPTNCVTPLAGLMTCGTFLTGSASETPTPQSECCNGLSAFLNSSSAAGNDDRTLRCLCPVILGDVNRMLPKPIDPVRMMYLPIACGVTLPPQAIYICFTGQQAPPLVSRIPEMWEKPTSASP